MRIVGGQHPSARPEEVKPVLFSDSNFTEYFDRDPSTSISHKVVNDFGLLAGNPESLSVRLPNNVLIFTSRKKFKAEKGFVARVGTGEPLPDPYLSETERSYLWRGFEDQTDVRFTVHNGYVRGSIVSPEGVYTVAGPFDDVAVNLIDLNNLPPSDAETFLGAGRSHYAPIQNLVEPTLPYSVADVDIDVLVMFTAQARIDAGGQVGLDALIQESMNSLNAAVQDSEIEGVSFNLAGTGELVGYTPSSDREEIENDLRKIRINHSANSARDNTNADVVMVLLRNFYDSQGNPQLAACGAAFLQNKICYPNTIPPDPNCTVGETFKEYAYGWASVTCATLPQRHSFPHELGHIMGAEHHSLSSSDPVLASFPWSFGYENRANAIATLMWAPNPGDPETPQYLQFSNPQVQINGFDSGVDGESENASTIFRLAPLVSGFRGPAVEVIFRDSFETGIP